MDTKVLARSLLVVGVAFSLSAAWGDKVDADHRVEWLTTVTDGVYNDASSWTGGEVPKDGIDGKYGLIDFRTTDITVRAPEGGFTDNSGTIFLGGGTEKHTLTLDTRGTWWRKTGVKAADYYWGMIFATDLQNNYAFAITSFDTVANTSPAWTFTDGLLTWTSDSESHEFDLLSGEFSFDKALQLDSAGGKKVIFRVHPEATLITTNRQSIAVWGSSGEPTELVFLGGNHSLNAVGIVGTWAGNKRANLVLTNDATVAIGNMFSVGGASGNNRGRVDLYGTSFFNLYSGEMYVGRSWYYKTAVNLNDDGKIMLHDQSTFHLVNNPIFLGYAHSSTGTVEVADEATFAVGPNGPKYTETWIGGWTNACGRLTVKDNGTFTYSSPVHMGTNEATSAVIEVKGNGRVMGTGANSVIRNESLYDGRSRISLADRGYLSTVGFVSNSSKMMIEANGGTIAAAEGQTPLSPFLSGCSVVLNEGGLMLDDTGADLTINQAFTDGATAGTLTKTGDGTLTVQSNSAHSKTHIANGTLKLGSGVTQFGKNLSFAKGTVLAFTDASSCVKADSLTFDTRLNISLPATLTSGTAYGLLKLTTPLTEEQVANIVVSSGASTQTYAFSVEDGTLKVTPSDYTPGDKIWTNGASTGAWLDASNWNPSSLPAIGDAAKIEADAAITLAGVGAAKAIEVGENVTASVTGAGALQVASGAALAEGAKLDLGVTLLGTDGAFTKTGKGMLTVSGDNASEMTNPWNLEGGITTFTSESALGVDSTASDAIAVSNCTFRYAGEEPATISRPITLTGVLPSIFDIEGDLTFDNFKITYPKNADGKQDAILVKTGAGKMTLNVPSGTTQLGAYSWTSGVNEHRTLREDGDVPFRPVSGEPTTYKGVGFFTVLDGCLEFNGQGVDKSSIEARHMASLGGSGWETKGIPELVFKNVTATFGNSGGHGFEMDVRATAKAPGSHLVIENATVDSTSSFTLGGNRHLEEGETAEMMNPVIAITNGLFLARGWTIIPDEGSVAFQYCTPTIRIGKGGVYRQQVTAFNGSYLYLGLRQDLWVEDGGLFEVCIPQQLQFTWRASGAVHLTRGGGMSVSRFISEAPDKPDADKGDPLKIHMNGGYLEFTKNGGISANYEARAVPSIVLEKAGGEIRVGEGITHALSIPITGVGTLTKSGAGTLVLTNDVAFGGTSTAKEDENKNRILDEDGMPIYTYTDQYENGEPRTNNKLANEGGIVIAEGTLRAVKGMVPDGTAISGEGTLSGVFETLNMSVTPGATTGLTFEDFTATKVYVDMGVSDQDTPPKIGTTTWIAKLADSAAFDAKMWKVKNMGVGRKVELSLSEDGVIIAKTVSNGFMVILR